VVWTITIIAKFSTTTIQTANHTFLTLLLILEIRFLTETLSILKLPMIISITLQALIRSASITAWSTLYAHIIKSRIPSHALALRLC